MVDSPRPARLTSDQVALVLRRAAEIEAVLEERPDTDGYDAAAVEAAADEVGLSPVAVRQALAELQAGILAETVPGPPAPAHVLVEQRLVPTTPGAVMAVLDRLLRAQLLERRRQAPDQALYRPRTDPWAVVRRKLNMGGTIWLDGLSSVTVVVRPVGDDTLVRAEAALATTRSNIVSAAAGAGVGVAMVVGLGGVLAGEPMLVVGAAPAGTIVAAGGVRVVNRRWRRHRDDLAEALAAIMDRL